MIVRNNYNVLKITNVNYSETIKSLELLFFKLQTKYYFLKVKIPNSYKYYFAYYVVFIYDFLVKTIIYYKNEYLYTYK